MASSIGSTGYNVHNNGNSHGHSNSHSHTKSVSYIKPSSSYLNLKGDSPGPRKMGLDIQTLNIKNQRNMSVDRVRDIYSSQQLSTAYNQNGRSNNIKGASQTNNSYDMKKGFLESFKDRVMAPKVKKSSMRNGEKISVSLLNNMHYRH